MTFFRILLAHGAALSFVAILAGCTTLPPANQSARLPVIESGSPTLSQEEVRQSMGEPSAVYQSSDKTIWFYNTDLRNLERNRLVFNAEGLLEAATPAFTRKAFQQFPADGTQSTTAVLHQFGTPLDQETPRDSILSIATNETPESTTPVTRSWIYGFREHNRYFVVSIRLNDKNSVISTDIEEDISTSAR